MIIKTLVIKDVFTKEMYPGESTRDTLLDYSVDKIDLSVD